MNQSYTFLNAGGRMGELIRNKDWAQTLFGTPDTWPQSLQSALSICLNSGFPIAIYWGKNFNLLYNDAWSTIPGDKHPWALGRPGREVWPEIWDGLDAQFNNVLNNGESIRAPDALLLMHRYGYTEECYFDYTLSPITDVNGNVGGVFNAVIETTYRVINERRNKLLHQITQQLNTAHTLAAAVEQTMQLLSTAQQDIVFCLLYTQVDSGSLQLTSAIHLDAGLAEYLQWVGAEKVMTDGATLTLTNIPDSLANIQGYWPESCREVVLTPLSAADTKVKGYIVAGTSPRKRLDDDYRHFIESVAINIGIALNNGYAYEQEELMQERIITSENRFRNMMEQAPVAMLMFRGTDMVIAQANKAILDILGKDTSIIGQPLFQAIPELKGQSYEEILEKVYQTGEPYYGYDMPAKFYHNGKLKLGYYDVSYTPLMEDGKIMGVLQVSADVTEQLKAKNALAQSEALLRNITSASPATLWMSDQYGMLTYINETWTTWTGRSFEEALNTGWTEAIVEEDRERARKQFRFDLEARRPYEVSFRINKKNGAVAWCLATGYPNFDADGNLLGYIGACTDITEKIESEQNLSATNTQLQSTVKELEFLTSSIPTIVWTSTPDGRVDFINEQSFVNNTPDVEGVYGTGWLNSVHPEDKEGAERLWQESVETGNKFETKFRLKRRDNEYRWFLVRAQAMHDSNGNIIKWYGTNTDIHEQKILEHQKDNFLGVASHELKTPVTSIKAYAQVLETMFRREGNEHKARLLTKLNGQIDRLTNLIGDLLDVTKIHTGRLQFSDDYFDFNSMVEDIIDDMQRTTTNHVITKELEFKGEVYGDKDRISQVIVNLLTNAIKYSPDARQVIVRTEANGSEVQLCVQDFGIGIGQEQASHVFEQFYRVSGSREHTFPGLGLGLYISSEIIKHEGGRIWVNSELGKGSSFCFALPVDRNKEQH